MPVEYPGNALLSPYVRKNLNYSTDDELLYSTARFTQKGVTLEAGQGVVTLGTLLSYNSVTKKYLKYDNTAGDATAHGVIRQSVDTGTDVNAASYQANLVISGILKLDKISTAGAALQTAGVVTASGTAALADLGARIDVQQGTFTF